jgi:lipopolysaccharide/colanic/teichoic acid biosynthesis glycosyltransferase
LLSVADIDQTRTTRAPVGTLVLEQWPPATRPADIPADAWPNEARLRRALNVMVACVGIVVTLPLMLVIAAAIKLCSPHGPVLFRQVRVGLDRRSPFQPSTNHRRKQDWGGRLFTLYKFRTMHPSTSDAPQVWASRNDPRIFPLGRFLRKYRFDELPQLVNVLMGDMNMVGPRPEQPQIFSELRDQIGRYSHRQRVRPGITGLAQVNHHYDTCIDDVRKKLWYDLLYMRRVSAFEDLRIMAQTIPAVILRSGGW